MHIISLRITSFFLRYAELSTLFGGGRWIHDYQDACVDKLEAFITGGGESSARLLSTTTRPDMSKASSVASPPPEMHGPVFPSPPVVADVASSAAAANNVPDNKDTGSKPRETTTPKGVASVRPLSSSGNSVKSTANKSHCEAI